MDYEKLLEEAYKKIKPIEKSKERFEIPEVNIMYEGNKTIILNFQQICSRLNRDVWHVEKFLQKELATPTKQQGTRLILQRKILKKDINERIEAYVKKYVICKECGKPDTELIKKDSFLFVHCLACGAQHSVPKI